MRKRKIEETIALNLERLMDDLSSSNPKLAKASHLGTGTIWRIRNAQGSVSVGNLDEIARALGVQIGELLRNPDLEPEQEEPVEGRRLERTGIPVVGTAQLGDDGYWLELDFPVGHGDGWVKYPASDPNAYALRCKGDSMRPRIKNGEFVVVEPNTQYRPGNDVLVRDKRGRAMVKVFNFERDGIYEVGSVNEDHKPITLAVEDIEFIHRVVAVLSPDAYYRDIA